MPDNFEIYIKDSNFWKKVVPIQDKIGTSFLKLNGFDYQGLKIIMKNN